MIVACPGCAARYRMESDRLRPEGVRLRCSRCEAVFQVSRPSAVGESREAVREAHTRPVAAQQAEAPRMPAPSLPPPMSRPTPPIPERSAADRQQTVLIADPEIEQGKATASAMMQWGLRPTLVHDGVEAMLAIQRLLPRAIVIDAALPKMFGFQVCEIVKRNESLRDIHVVLVGAIHDRTRYRRPPEEIYGADAYVERQDLPGSLYSIFAEFGMLPAVAPSSQPRAAQAAVASPRVRPIVDPVSVRAATLMPEREVAARAPAAAPIPVARPAVSAPKFEAAKASGSAPGRGAGIDERIQQAERLARIVVSDIVLYSQEKFAAAVRAGNVLEAMKGDLAEGRSLFAARVDPAIQQERDFLAEELLRVAKARSGA